MPSAAAATAITCSCMSRTVPAMPPRGSPDRLLRRIVEPIQLADGSTVGTSIGIAEVTDPISDPVTADELLQQAVLAVSTAEHGGTGRAVPT